MAAEDGKSRGSMNKARQVTPVMVRRIAWPALNRDSKQGRPVDSHCKLSFALPPQLSSVFTPASDQMPFSQNFWAYRQNAVVMLPSAALPPEPGKLPLMLQKAKPVQPAPKQRCSAWHCSCSGIPTVLFSSQGPVRTRGFGAVCRSPTWALLSQELSWCLLKGAARCAAARTSAMASSALLQGQPLPRVTGETQGTAVWERMRHSQQLTGNEGAYRSGSASCPVLRPASQCATRACCCIAGSAAVPHSNMGCQSFSGSGTWAGAQPTPRK